jgi:TRAP-type mannitol/chloroaromatic compound transport system permease small subunit
VLITVLDVVARKLTFRMADGHVYGLQIWLKTYISRYFESTLLQELEWHLHTALFALVLGFGTIYNTHVRVDLVRDHVSFRKKIWIEFLGLTCFMIPYLLLVIYFASSWVFDSFKLGEISASTVGLSHRWIIKGILVLGLIVATIAGVAVWLQVVTLIWGRNVKRFKLMTLDWPEDVSRIEGKERIVLDEAPGMQAPPEIAASIGAPPGGAQPAIKPAE